jgi:hypothetical protein
MELAELHAAAETMGCGQTGGETNVRKQKTLGRTRS